MSHYSFIEFHNYDISFIEFHKITNNIGVTTISNNSSHDKNNLNTLTQQHLVRTHNSYVFFFLFSHNSDTQNISNKVHDNKLIMVGSIY